MKKNILILATVGGFLMKFETENVKLLQSLGYRVHYAANMREQHYLFEETKLKEIGVEAHHIDIERSPYMVRENKKAFDQLLDIIDRFEISMIHCHTPVGGVLGRLAGRYFKKKNIIVIYTAHGFHFYKGAPLLNNTVYYLVERFLARYTDILITINKEDYSAAGRFCLKKKGKVYLVPGVGLDMEYFHPLSGEEKKKNRESMGNADRFFLVTVGELNENKNQQIILKALHRMKIQKRDISGIVYGICGDGFFYDRIRRQIEEMGLSENVSLYGYQTDVRRIVGCADCFVFPSIREGLGMAALEALSMGIPVVGADNRGTREYLRHKENGYICQGRDENSFIQGIEFIKNQSVEQRKAMQIRCRESVGSFAKKQVKRKMEIIYRRMKDEDIGDYGGI
ncbi:glycosyltransferase family 4 protein [Mediterraneibacter sp. NSJ-55]|uniref:Glycosyltransferase family 4 protein n=1 Tax=Mediterraneibacter hominis TaxID=2763054 RepID=A0A923LJA2_9FIRM|nr:glycosyltransferase family 4 protein [Mediterraneibacter hominis]MBC5689800.1 glycosyltransferase family 4 protein [Mediterraneibacter hominis]